MKKVSLLLAFICVIFSQVEAQKKKKDKKDKDKNKQEVTTLALPTFMDSLSYAYGISIGMDFKRNSIEGMKGELIGKGIQDMADTSAKLVMTEAQAMDVIQQYSQRLQEEREKALEAQYAPIKQAGIEFLAKNKLRPEVITLPNGLQYEIITEGAGEKPSLKDQVRVHYTGYTIDNKVFDSSVQRGQPAEFPLKGVIPGWTQILQIMPVGSTWKVYIPQELAYGKNGAGQAIPPYSTLIFEIQLLDIVSPR